MFLLDTNIAIAFAEYRSDIERRLAELDGPLFISIVTVIELQGGVASDAVRRAERRQALDRVLRVFEVLPLGREEVDAYGSMVLATGFSRPRTLDRLIAATAITHDLTVITTNGADFGNVPGLKLEVWPRPAQ